MENEATSKNIRERIKKSERTLGYLENFKLKDFRKLDQKTFDFMIAENAERGLKDIEEVASDALGELVMFDGETFVRRKYKKASIATVRDAIKELKLLGY